MPGQVQTPVGQPSTEQIARVFGVESEQVEAKQSQLNGKEFSKGFFGEKYQVVKGLAALILFPLGLLYAAYTKASVVSHNRSLNVLRNPADLTRAVNALAETGVSVENAFDHQFIDFTNKPLTQGMATKQKQDRYDLQNAVNSAKAQITKMEKRIEGMTSNPDERRALLAAVLTQATAVETKDVFGNGPKTGFVKGADVRAVARMLLNRYDSRDVESVGRELAQQFKPAGSLKTKADLQAYLKDLAGLEKELLIRAAKNIEIMTGTQITDDNGMPRQGVFTGLSSDIMAKVKAKKEEYREAMKTALDGEYAKFTSELSALRNNDTLSANFLNDMTSELRDIAGNGDKSEEQLVRAIRYLNVDPESQKTLAKEWGVDPQAMTERAKMYEEAAPLVAEKMENAYDFLTNLDAHYSAYVSEKEEQAQLYIDAIKAVALFQGENRSEVAAMTKALKDSSKEQTVAGVKVPPKIDAKHSATKSLVSEKDVIDLFSIVLGGNGTPGSPTLANALVDSLVEKGIYPKLKATIKETPAYKAFLEEANKREKEAEERVEKAKEARDAEWKKCGWTTSTEEYKKAKAEYNAAAAYLREIRQDHAGLFVTERQGSKKVLSELFDKGLRYEFPKHSFHLDAIRAALKQVDLDKAEPSASLYNRVWGLFGYSAEASEAKAEAKEADQTTSSSKYTPWDIMAGHDKEVEETSASKQAQVDAAEAKGKPSTTSKIANFFKRSKKAEAEAPEVKGWFDRFKWTKTSAAPAA